MVLGAFVPLGLVAGGALLLLSGGLTLVWGIMSDLLVGRMKYCIFLLASQICRDLLWQGYLVIRCGDPKKGEAERRRRRRCAQW